MSRDVQQIFDEVLVLHAQSGNRQAMQRLAARWRPRHLAHARRMLGTADRAADAVQDAWVSIIRGFWRLEDPSRFAAWSYAILIRKCNDIFRRASRSPGEPLDEEAVADAPPEYGDSMDIDHGLGALPPEQRAAISLFYVDGFTVSEIAEALRIPVGTVKSRLFHARRELRRILSGEVR